MIVKNSELECVAVRKDQYPQEDKIEVAFAGRSNVGKSSLLNLITGRKKLARVSGSPGKTRTINFYLINGEFRIVDLPGYGYAKVSKSISESWGKMMSDYLETRPNLATVVQLVDIRHDPSKQDVEMYRYLKHFGLSGIVVATKSDKMSSNQKQKNISRIRKVLQMGENEVVIPVSALKKTGQDKLMEAIENAIYEFQGVSQQV